jgi:hypothetical protein
MTNIQLNNNKKRKKRKNNNNAVVKGDNLKYKKYPSPNDRNKDKIKKFIDPKSFLYSIIALLLLGLFSFLFILTFLPCLTFLNKCPEDFQCFNKLFFKAKCQG